MLSLKFTIAILIFSLVHHALGQRSIEQGLFSVECLDENDIYYPSYKFPADKDWLSTYPSDGDFENMYENMYAAESSTSTANFQPPSLLPHLDPDYIYVCDKNHVPYEFSPIFAHRRQCANATEDYGFLPNSNKFILMSDDHWDDYLFDIYGFNKTAEYSNLPIFSNPALFNKDRPFLRFWLAADCAGDPACAVLISPIDSLSDKSFEIPINSTECPSTGKWKRYTVFIGDPISDVLGPTNTFIEALKQLLGFDSPLFNSKYSDVNYDIIAVSAALFNIKVTAPKGAAITNVEFIGGNWPNKVNTSSRAASIKELDFGDSDVNYLYHLINNPNDLIIFILFMLFTFTSAFLISRDTKKADKTNAWVTRFLVAWFVVSISLSLYGIIDLVNFTDVSKQFEKETLNAVQAFEKSLEKNLLFEITEQAQGVEPYGVILQEISGFPLNAQQKLIELFNAKAKSDWSETEKSLVHERCTLEGFNSQYICFEADNCTEESSGYDETFINPYSIENLDNFESDLNGTDCFRNCTRYSKTYSNPCETTAACPSEFRFTNQIYGYDLSYCYANYTNCSIFNAADAISTCSSFDNLVEFISEFYNLFSTSLSFGDISISGNVILSQTHITDLLIYSLVAGVVFILLELLLYILLLRNRKARPATLLRGAIALEAFNIAVLLVSICMTAVILYYIVNEPVKVDIKKSELLVKYSLQVENVFQDEVATTDFRETFVVPVQINPDILRYEDTTFRPVLDVPFDEISQCFEDQSILNNVIRKQQISLSFDYKTNEICDFGSTKYYNSSGMFCYSVPCSDGVFPLSTEKAVKDRIDFLYANVVYGILIIDFCITLVDVLVCILSVRKLRQFFSDFGWESDSYKSNISSRHYSLKSRAHYSL